MIILENQSHFQNRGDRVGISNSKWWQFQNPNSKIDPDQIWGIDEKMSGGKRLESDWK